MNELNGKQIQNIRLAIRDVGIQLEDRLSATVHDGIGGHYFPYFVRLTLHDDFMHTWITFMDELIWSNENDAEYASTAGEMVEVLFERIEVFVDHMGSLKKEK